MIMKESSGNDFDFVLTATRTESSRKLKVPGDVAPVGKMSFEVERMREEIKSKSVCQLREILERQDKILSNSALVSKLPDKGEKARSKREVIVNLLKEKERLEGLESQMKMMKIDTEKMEWKGRLLDSDDDSDVEAEGPVKDPLALLAQGVVPARSSKAKEIQSENPSVNEIELFAQKEVEMFDKVDSKKTFVPFQSTNSSIKDEQLKLQLHDLRPRSEPGKAKSPAHRTPSIPLPPVYDCQTKKLSLAESLRLQQEQDVKLREVQLKHAASKLMASKGLTVAGESEVRSGLQFEEYRDNEEDDEQEEDDDEGHGVVGITQHVIDE